MTQSNLIWEKWKNKNYSGVATYSLMKQPEFLQSVCQKAFIETMIVRIRRITGFKKFVHTVDLGCATGDWSYKYLGFSEKVTGIDLNKSFIEEALKKRLLCQNPENITFLQSNLLDYGDYSQNDFVCSGAVLMYIDDDQLEKLTAKISSGLKDGSWAYIRVSVKAAFHKRKDTEGGYYRTRDFYRDLFKRNGFEIIDTISASHVIIHEIIRAYCKFFRIPVIENLFFRVLAFFIILKQLIFGGNDYLNLILKKNR